MTISSKQFQVQSGELSLFSYDNYVVPSGVPSLEQDGNGNIILNNISDNPNTNNFYGDGRHGDLVIRSNTEMTQHAFYFEQYENHPIYGHILKNVWHRNNIPFEKGEYVLQKKHVRTVEQVLNYDWGRWEIVDVLEVINDGANIHYKIAATPSITFDMTSANAAGLVYQFRDIEVQANCKLELRNSTLSTVDSVSVTRSPNMVSAGWPASSIFSAPDGTFMFKVQNKVVMRDKGVIISSFGLSAYSNMVTGVVGGTTRPLASGPLGSNVTVISGNAVVDNWALGGDGSDVAAYYNGRTTPGSPGNYGGNKNKTSYGIPLPVISDLNRNIHYGLGGHSRLYSNRRGMCGGGSFILHSPHLELRNGAYIASRGHDRGSLYEYNIRGGCGSILIKVNNVEVYNDSNAYDGTGLDKQPFAVSRTDTAATHAPGLCQLEFDSLKWVDSPSTTPVITTFTPTTLSGSDSTKRKVFSVYKDIDLQNNYVNTTANDTGGVPWVYQGNYISREFSDISPKYNTGKYWKLRTNPLKTLSLKGWYTMTQFQNRCILPPGTDIRFLFSKDGGTTWKAIDFSGSQPVLVSASLNDTDISNKGNTPEQLNYTSSANLTRLFIEPQIGETEPTLDLMVAFRTTDANKTPAYSYLWVDGEMAGTLAPPIPMRPYDREEFAGSDVNFVWLQPEQLRGSIANRVEISDTPNFNTMNDVLTSSSNVSALGEYIVNPLSPVKYNNSDNNFAYFKMPYMKSRFAPITSSAENNLPSVVWNETLNEIQYTGGDIYFYKGNDVISPKNINIAIPSKLDFKMNSSSPLWSSAFSYMKFTGVTDPSQVIDEKYNWAIRFIAPALVVRPSLAHGTLLSYPNTANAKSHVETPISVDGTNPLVNKTMESTFVFRFSPTALTPATYNTILTMKNGASTASLCQVMIYPYDAAGRRHYTVGLYNGSVWNICYHHLLNENDEIVFVVTNSGSFYNLYMNGILVIKNMPNAANLTAGAYNNKSVRFMFFQESDTTSYCQGDMIEFYTFNKELSVDEVVSISGVANYDLRLNLNTNQLGWFRRPYWDHVQEYERSTDRAFYTGNYTLDSGCAEVNFIGDEWNYISNNHSVLIGRFNPTLRKRDAWIPIEQSATLSRNIPFHHNYVGGDWLSWKNNLITTENNSIRTTGVDYLNPLKLVKHGRILARSESVRYDFVFEDTELNVPQSIEFCTGRSSDSAVVYTRRFQIRINKTNPVVKSGYDEFSYDVRWRLVYNNTTILNVSGSTEFEFPFPLKIGHKYNVRFDTLNNVATSSIWIYSDTDVNYTTGAKLHQFSSINSYGWMNKRYNQSNSWTAIDSTVSNTYEDVWLGISTNTNLPAFVPISVVTYNSSSVIDSLPGHILRYDMNQVIRPQYLKKINRVAVETTVSSSATKIRFFVSFDGNVWKKWSTNQWITVETTNVDNGMSVEEISLLGIKQYTGTGGMVTGSSFFLKTVMETSNVLITPKIKKIDISYNGPYVYDSWNELGSSYDSNVKFYFNSSGSWNPFIDLDFTTWTEMGSDKPNTSILTSINGSPGSTNTNKVYGGCTISVVPTGYWYWRVAAYNGT